MNVVVTTIMLHFYDEDSILLLFFLYFAPTFHLREHALGADGFSTAASYW